MGLRCDALPSNLDNQVRIVIRRKYVFEDTLHQFRCGLSLSKHLRITFIGEPAIDDGGPMLEYLRLLLRSLSTYNSLFCGEIDRRCVQHNVSELSKKTYCFVGKMIAMSLVYGGPAPSFFAPPIADYIVFGLDKVKPQIEDIPDFEVRDKLFEVSLIL